MFLRFGILSELFARKSGLADPHVPLLPHLNRKFELVTADQLRTLYGKNPRLDAVIPKGFLKFLDQGFLNLSFRVNNRADQPFAKGPIR